MQNFKERLSTLRTGLSVRLTLKNAFHQMRIPRWLQVFIALPAVLGPHRKDGRPATSFSRIFDFSCSYNTSGVFFLGRIFSVKMSRITARPREVLTLLFAFVVTTLLHRCPFANMACWLPLVVC